MRCLCCCVIFDVFMSILFFVQGAVRLPSLFGADFGDQITRLATLIDAKENQFEVLVERINGAFFLSKGWKALRDFYGIRLGAWITLVYLGLGKFAILLKDRFQKVMRCPVFDPPMCFVIDKTNVQPTFNNNLPPFTANLSFRHDGNDFTFELPRRLNEQDVSKGYLVSCTFYFYLHFYLSAYRYHD